MYSILLFRNISIHAIESPLLLLRFEIRKSVPKRVFCVFTKWNVCFCVFTQIQDC